GADAQLLCDLRHRPPALVCQPYGLLLELVAEFPANPSYHGPPPPGSYSRPGKCPPNRGKSSQIRISCSDRSALPDPRRLLPLVQLQESLPQPDSSRRHFDELVVADELECVLERELLRCLEQDRFVGAGSADVRELLALGDVDFQVAGAGVLTDDHALVDGHAGSDEQLAAFLEVPEGERDTGAVGHAHHDAAVAAADR